MNRLLTFALFLCVGGLLAQTICSRSGAALPQPASTVDTRPDGAIRLTTPISPTSHQNPAFSPTGQTILFTVFHQGYNIGPAGLYALSLSGGSPAALLDEAGQDSVNLPGTSWNAATNRIVFASDRQDTDEIWTMSPDGSDLFRVTHHTSPTFFIEPSFSPDGQWIVFEIDNDVPDDQQQGSIWKVRANGSEAVRLIDGPATNTDNRQPNWSPVGGRILFQRRAPGSDDWNLYTMAADGSDIRQVTTDPAADTDASWSPNGACIVYSTNHGGLPVPDIFVISANGGTPTRITSSDTHEDGAPSWSPDGQWIAFESHEGADEAAPSALWRIAAPGGACAGGKQRVYLPLALRGQASAAGPLPLANVTYWGYQIQAISGTVGALTASRYDMLVLEPTRTDWSSNNKLFDTREMVTRLKDSQAHDGIHRKLVIAYIDIGQAEDWRWYWKWSTGWDCATPRPADWPAYILTCDPDGWVGNYPVAYWDPAWKNIVITGTALNSAPYGDYVSILDEVIRDGFDGVYLDWVEGFENAEVIAAAQAAGRDPAGEMIAFIRQMKAYAAARNPNFIVIQQNAAALVDGHPELFNVIDAIAQEGVWYDGVATDDWNDPAGYDTPTDPALTVEYLGWLDQYLNAGLPVFNCEYALNYAATAYAKAYNKSYKPYVTRRSLGRLTTTPPPGY